MQASFTQVVMINLFRFARGTWRHRLVMVALAWFVCVCGWVFVQLMEDVYISSARVQIYNPQSDLASFLQDRAITIDVTTEARKALNTLLSRDNLLKVIQKTDLATEISNEEELNEAVATLRAQVNINPLDKYGTSYSIQHKHTNPKITYQVTSSLVEMLLTLSESDSTAPAAPNTARTAQNILKEQIRQYEAKLAQSEIALQEYRQKNSLLLPGSDGGYYARVGKQTNQLDEEKIQLREMENQREEVVKQMREKENMGGATPEAGIRQKISEYETELLDRQSQFYHKGGRKIPLYDEGHPDILSLREKITLLNEQLRKLREPSIDSSAHPELNDDEVYQQLKITLGKLDVELASKRTRINELEKQLADLKKLSDTLPSVEAELLRYERNYNITKEKLLTLLGQEGNASFSSDVVERLSRHVQFEIANKPNLPGAPSGPNRLLFNSVVLVMGLLIGIVAATLLSIMRPVFDNPSVLKHELGLPVLGMISMVAEQRTAPWLYSNISIGGSIGGLLVVYALLVVID